MPTIIKSYRSDDRPEVFPESVGPVANHHFDIGQELFNAVKESEDEAFAYANDNDGPRCDVIIKELKNVHPGTGTKRQA